MLAVEPRLLRDEVAEPLGRLIHAGLDGELDVSLTADLSRFVGPAFKDLAMAALDDDRLSPVQTDNLAAGLGLSVADDPDVFDCLVRTACRRPSLLLEAVLSTYDLPDTERIALLAMAIDRLEGPATVAVRVCADAMRRLLDTMDDEDRASCRDMCRWATVHALSLSSPR